MIIQQKCFHFQKQAKFLQNVRSRTSSNRSEVEQRADSAEILPMFETHNQGFSSSDGWKPVSVLNPIEFVEPSIV